MTKSSGARPVRRVLHAEDAFRVVDRAEPAPPREAPPRVALHVKRGLDVGLALVLLVALAPLLALVALVIRLDSRGPVLFAHRRLGRGGRHFDCLKFRSMRRDAEQLLFADARLRHEYVARDFKVPVHADPRVTRVGRVLRRTSLDELPQLLNVLRGEMSLVGPRPIVALEGTHYGRDLPALLSLRPGITGAWAVGGRNALGYPARAQVELQYVRDWSLGRDLRILAKTPWTVLTQRGSA
ncbi:MAG TPA: sugar transferase [Gemmatimonadaceae bacterium]